MAPRHLAAAALVLALTVTGFFAARALTERDAHRASEQRVEIAAAQIRSRLDEATSLTDSLQQFMFSEAPGGVSNDKFARNTLRWLLPAGLGAAAWVEPLRESDRPGFERRLGHAIVTPGAQYKRTPRASSYMPTALVSGFPPLNRRGVDLSREPGLLTAVRRAESPGNAGATAVAARKDGTTGLFLVARAPNVVDGALRPGFVVLFVSETTLRAAAKNAPELRLSTIADPSAAFDPGRTVRQEFTVAGQRFSVVLPEKSVAGTSAILPWLILAGGLVLVAGTAALGANAARRVKAQADLDRLFTLSPDVITVANFEGRLTRVNPAAERVLGYTAGELLERPYLDFVHPDDREKTAAEAAALGAGSTTLSFENRYVRKDGTERVLEWTATPVVRDKLMYGVARDVTERRQTEVEQAALRRIATLVAEGVTGPKLFEAVARAVAEVFDVATVSIDRYDDHGASTVVASLEDPGFPVGSRWPLDGPSVGATVQRTREPARIDDYSGLDSSSAAAMRESGVNSAVGAPILVDGRPWGVICVASTNGHQVRVGTEPHLARFADLLATALARAESREELATLADEQAALRRVATLVAHGAPHQELFTAVVAEVGGLLRVGCAEMGRFDSDGLVTTVSTSSGGDISFPTGGRWRPVGKNVTAMVFDTGRHARLDDYANASGPIGERGREAGYSSAVASPITVEGRLWGMISAATTADEPLPAGIEARLASFTELVATAIAKAESKSELAASRRRIVAASDEARRRIERDLHDGTQQRLLALALAVQSAEVALPSHLNEARKELSRISAELGDAITELQAISRGIHPAILSHGGLGPALRTLARRSAVPVEVDVHLGDEVRLPQPVEVAAYFVVSEALANATKHAQASRVEISLGQEHGSLRLSIRDDGIGGADRGRGSGLVGLADRVEALGGSIVVRSRPGEGTYISAELPVEASDTTTPI